MNSQLIELSEQFRLHAKRAERIVSKAGAERIAVRPRPDSWSAAECLVHLTLSTEVFLPVWKAAFAGAPQENGPFKMDLAGKILTWLLQPPPRLRIKTKENLQPLGSGDALARFLASQTQLLDVVSSSTGLAPDRIKIASPVDGRVRYNVWSSFRVTEAHQRRHLWQAERVLGLSE